MAHVNAAVKKYDTELHANVSDLMKLFTDRKTFDYDKFPFFSQRLRCKKLDIRSLPRHPQRNICLSTPPV